MTTALLAIKPPYTMRERWLAAYRDWRRGRRDLEPGQTPAQLALMTIQRIGRIGAIPTDVMDVRVRTPIGRKPAWWQVAGKTCVAAYQPKGAASLAASYVNLANPGTYDAAPGVAPTLTADGWTFDGTTQYLTTGVQATNQHSALVRYSNLSSAAFGYLFGGYSSGVNYWGFANFSTTYYWINFDVHQLFSVPAEWSSGVWGMTHDAGYYNGISQISLNTNVQTPSPLLIGTRDTTGLFKAGDIQAIAIYSDTLTAGEVAAVSAVMAAL